MEPVWASEGKESLKTWITKAKITEVKEDDQISLNERKISPGVENSLVHQGTEKTNLAAAG